jgi:hypothetical protein
VVTRRGLPERKDPRRCERVEVAAHFVVGRTQVSAGLPAKRSGVSAAELLPLRRAVPRSPAGHDGRAGSAATRPRGRRSALTVAAAGSVIAAGGALLGAGTAMAYPTLLAAIGDVAHPAWRASSLGVYRLWRDLGSPLERRSPA